MSPLILDIVMFAALACLIGGGVLIARGQDRQKGVLMLITGAVLIGNLAIWTM